MANPDPGTLSPEVLDEPLRTAPQRTVNLVLGGVDSYLCRLSYVVRKSYFVFRLRFFGLGLALSGA